MKFLGLVGAVIGTLLGGGFLGAIAGYVFGSALQNAFTGEDESSGQPNTDYGYQGDTYSSSVNHQQQVRARFIFSIMVLSSHIIKADGKIMHSEMEHVRRFLENNFAAMEKNEGEAILLRLFDYRKQQGEYEWRRQLEGVCSELNSMFSTEVRSQLMAYLCDIIKADGKIDRTEVDAAKDIARLLLLNSSIVDSLLSLGGTELDDAYRVLGVSADCSDAELRRAYRALVKKYHPDLVEGMGNDVKETAKRGLQEINNAKEIIDRARAVK